MKIDSFFIKGQSHDICQDYAMHGEVNGLSYAMISDGCSMISDNDGKAIPHPSSDIASRIVCLAAKKTLGHLSLTNGRNELSKEFFDVLSTNVKTQIDVLNETSNLADATLSLITLKDNILGCVTIGDGVLVVERKEQTCIYIRKYTPNYPVYLSYLINIDKYYRYLSNNVKLELTKININNDEIIEYNHTETIDAYPLAIDNIYCFDTDDVKSISVFSDGISDMIYAKKDPISINDAVKNLISIPNPCGLFVRRKLKSIVRSQTTSIGPNDDLSMATIIF